MPDENEKKFSIPRILQVVIAVVGVSITFTSFVVGYLARKKELSCTHQSSEKLVSVSTPAMPDLKVDFKGERVVSLTKMNFVLRNSGGGCHQE